MKRLHLLPLSFLLLTSPVSYQLVYSLHSSHGSHKIITKNESYNIDHSLKSSILENLNEAQKKKKEEACVGLGKRVVIVIYGAKHCFESFICKDSGAHQDNVTSSNFVDEEIEE